MKKRKLSVIAEVLTPATRNSAQISDDIDPSSMKVAELRIQLEKRGLDTTGKKAQLIERLSQSLANNNMSPSKKARLTSEETEAPAITETENTEKEEAERDIYGLKVAELKSELQKLGLDTSGRKSELQTRLSAAIKGATVQSDSNEQVSMEENSDVQDIDFTKMKVVELRTELEKRNLNATGNKAVLVKRLQDASVGDCIVRQAFSDLLCLQNQQNGGEIKENKRTRGTEAQENLPARRARSKRVRK